MIVLDTNIVIGQVQGDPAIVAWAEKQFAVRETFAISSLSVIELLSYPKSSSEEIELIENFLASTLVIDLNLTIAREAARIRKETKLTVVDSAIAASALLWSLPLATRDKAFKKVPNLQLTNHA